MVISMPVFYFMKRFELILALILIPLDIAMLFSASLLAYFLRFEGIVTRYRPVIFELPFADYLQAVFPFIGLWMILFALSGLYSIVRPQKFLREVKNIVISGFLGFAAITIMIFLRGELFNSRFIVLAGTLLGITLVILARLIIRLIRFQLYKYSIGTRKVLLVGEGDVSDRIVDSVKTNYRHGLSITHRINSINEDFLVKLRSSIQDGEIDMVLLSDPTIPRPLVEELLDIARDHHIQFAYIADLFNTKLSNTDISTVGDIPLVEIKQTPLDGWGRIVKRIFDVFAGSILLILSLPIMLIIAIFIKLESKGPIFYKNQRVGKGRELFFLYKFRRFKTEFNTGPGYDESGKARELEEQLIEKQNERVGPIYKVLNDPRNTKVGAFLEKTSLDELPQFINVLKGDISLVGPRPHQPHEVDGYQREHKRIFVARPGITGLAQISGRSDLDYDEEARLDIYYIENWSLKADIAILLKTPFALLKRHK